MQKKLTFKLFVFVSVTLLFLLIAGWLAKQTLLGSLADYDAEVPSSDISASMEVYRDTLGVPYILASNEEDAAFALGYLHAQERMFQMDMMRRAGEGRLAEILGSQGLAFDKMFLTIGIERTAKAIWEAAHPETKKMLTAYAKGVNEFLRNHSNTLSIEFDVLNYRPYEWKPYHSIIIIRLMAWELNIAWWEDLAFTYISQNIGRQKAERIFPFFSENHNMSSLPNIPTISESDLSLLKTDRLFRQFSGFTGTHIGSNNWVIGPAKSSTNAPMIANDPHLAHQAPGKWYIACINAGNLKAAGVTLPGIPAIVIGKNENLSWALTNVMADDADFYAEILNEDKTKYLLDDDWKPLKKITYLRKVKDSTDVHIEVLLNHRGPLISDVHPVKTFFPGTSKKLATLSMRWMGNEISDEYYSFYLINNAKNQLDFKNAVSHFCVPGQNFVFAEKNGGIGYVCGARLAIRDGKNAGFAMDGTTSSNDWKGFVPRDEMPSIANPQENFIATANNKVVPSFPYYISNLWEPRSRIERIDALLKSREQLSVDDFKRFQMDQVSPYALSIVPYITESFKNVKINDNRLREALNLITLWDGDFNPGSQAPAIYAVFFKNLLKNTLMDDLGYDLFNEFCFVANVPYRVMQRLLAENADDIFDNITTRNKIESREDIIRKSLADALTELERIFGTDIKQWQWGSLHKVRFKHMFHGKASIIDNIVDIGPFPIGGDGTTVFNTEYPFFEYHGDVKSFNTTPFENLLGPSMRYIFDFSHPDRFYIILPTGQSGNIFSGHYSDMTQGWLYGGYREIRTDIESVKKNRHLMKFLRR